ncbi:MAG: 1-acyl-sn-glycerol-3-phosphate acyltransferase [Bacilli bacterium]|nr:1-acyl-sn-glycerol-3-phosphate acyltransferase [Bacilli bacterium]
MQEKLTLQKKLEKKKYKAPNPLVYKLLSYVFIPILRRKFHVKETVIDKVPKKGPMFVIFNHQSRLDYLYVSPLAAPRKLNYIVAYNEHFRSHLKMIFNLMHVIPKKNFTLDMVGMRGIDSVIKKGGAVAFSPEAMSSIYGQNQPIVPGTGKMFKHYGVPIYFVELRGAYLSNTKVCLDNRYGEIHSSIRLLFSEDDLKKLTAEEINNKINEAFRIDDYEWQKEKHIKWETKGNICSHLHDINYQCPKCGSEFTMIGEKDTIRCTKCGNEAKMNDYYEFVPTEGSVIPESPNKWVLYERENIIKAIRKDPNYSFIFHTKIGTIPPYHYLKHKKFSEIVGDGDITINHQGIHFKGTKNNEPYSFSLSYEEVYTLGMPEDATFFNLFVDYEYVELHPDQPVVGKTLLLVEEMHRLHVNRWKNFPWFDYLYKKS